MRFISRPSPCHVSRAWAVGSLTLLFLQSVTWSSGLMFLSAPSLLLAYLFSSLNTAQALLITILHCTLARKVCLCVHGALCNCRNLSLTSSFVTKQICLYIAGRVRRTMAGACVSRIAVPLPLPALRTRWRVLPCGPTAATPAARVAELLLTDRYITIPCRSLCLAPAPSLFLSLSVLTPCGIFLFQSRIRRMWNDTVRRQTESSFIAADVNNTPTLNRGADYWVSFFLISALPPSVVQERYIYLSPSPSSAALGNHFLTNQVLQTHAGASPYDTMLAQGYNQPFTSTGTFHNNFLWFFIILFLRFLTADLLFLCMSVSFTVFLTYVYSRYLLKLLCHIGKGLCKAAYL